MQQGKQLISQYYKDLGIKQYSSYSGGFKFIQKKRENQVTDIGAKKTLDRQSLFKQMGISNTKTKTYKLDNDYVPDTKAQLADKLMQKIEHQMKKMKYYRQKYYNNSQNR